MAGNVGQPEAIYVVRAYVINRATGARTSESIIGMFVARAEAERLVEVFDEQTRLLNRKTNQEETRAHLVRYDMPYVAPAVKRLMR